MGAPDTEFFKRLPKVELHAHLTGSISRRCLQDIWEMRKAVEPELDLVAPDIALANKDVGQNIDTFFSLFNTYLYSLITTIPTLQHATRSVLNDFAADGVAYLELRTTPRSMAGATIDVTIGSILNVIEGWEGSMTVGLILTIDRAKHTAADATNIVDLAHKLRSEGRRVVGLDLAGDPKAPLAVDGLRPAFALARQRDIPFTLHFAEIPASSARSELEELLSWRPSRLGHAIHVPLDLRTRIIEENVAVELCLTCNVLAGMLPERERKASYVDHHFGWWWSHGAGLSLGTDDVGVFHSPNSEEHRLVAEHFDLSSEDLRTLNIRSLQYAFGDTAAAAARLEKFV